MIGIKLDGDDEFLETNPETSISMRLENPVFGDPERLSPGSFSYPFTLPGGRRSPVNAAKLKNPDVIENTDHVSIQDAKLFFAGVPLKVGNMRVQEAGPDNLSTYFTFGLNALNPLFKTGTLRSIFLTQFVIGLGNITKKIYFSKLSAGAVGVIANGREYIEPDGVAKWANLQTQIAIDCKNETLDQPDKWWPAISAISAAGSTPSGLITGGYVTFVLRQYYTVSPGVFATRDCEDPLQELSIQVDASVADDYVAEVDLGTYYDDFTDFLASYRTVNPDSPIIRFPLMFNSKLHADVTKESEAINLWDSDGFVLNDPNYGINNGSSWAVKNYNSLQPFVRLRYVLDFIGQLLGTTWEGDFYDDTDTEDILIDHSVTLDLPQGLVGPSKFIFWRRSFAISELLPDVSIVDFLKAVQSRYNLAIYPNERTGKVRMAYREPIAKSKTYEDITSITSRTKPGKNERYQGYVIRVPKEKYDDFSSDEVLRVGDGEKDFKMACSRLWRTQTIYHDGAQMEGPYKAQPHNVEFGMRFFHYEGIVHNGAFNYPKARIHGAVRSEVLADIHDDYWRYWLHFEQNRILVPVEINLPLRKLLRIDWELKRRFNRTDFLIKSLDVKLSNRSVEITAAELYTMRG